MGNCRDSFLPFAPPSLGEEEVEAVAETLRSGWITTGPKTREFEEAFAGRFGAPDALALNSCTAGLHISLVALGIGPGDEVCVPDITFCSTANVVVHAGAAPVLVDVEPDTLNIDPEALDRACTPRTRAVIAVHLAGHPAELDRLRAIAGDRGIHLVEDAAHAVAASYRGKVVGSSDNLAAFSFYATKNLATGEGGMLTGHPDLIDRARPLSLHGMSRDAWKRYDKAGSWRYDVAAPGYKYNMTDIQAALGLCQLAKLDSFQQHRSMLAGLYDEGFSGCDLLELPARRPEVDHAWHIYLVRLRLEALTIDRDQVIEEMRSANIGTSVHFIPLHLHSYYAERCGVTSEQLPVASAAFPRLLSLPIHPGMSRGDAEQVAAILREILERNRR